MPILLAGLYILLSLEIVEGQYISSQPSMGGFPMISSPVVPMAPPPPVVHYVPMGADEFTRNSINYMNQQNANNQSLRYQNNQEIRATTQDIRQQQQISQAQQTALGNSIKSNLASMESTLRSVNATISQSIKIQMATNGLPTSGASSASNVKNYRAAYVNQGNNPGNPNAAGYFASISSSNGSHYATSTSFKVVQTKGSNSTVKYSENLSNVAKGVGAFLLSAVPGANSAISVAGHLLSQNVELTRMSLNSVVSGASNGMANLNSQLAQLNQAKVGYYEYAWSRNVAAEMARNPYFAPTSLAALLQATGVEVQSLSRESLDQINQINDAIDRAGGLNANWEESGIKIIANPYGNPSYGPSYARLGNRMSVFIAASPEVYATLTDVDSSGLSFEGRLSKQFIGGVNLIKADTTDNYYDTVAHEGGHAGTRALHLLAQAELQKNPNNTNAKELLAVTSALDFNSDLSSFNRTASGAALFNTRLPAGATGVESDGSSSYWNQPTELFSFLHSGPIGRELLLAEIQSSGVSAMEAERFVHEIESSPSFQYMTETLNSNADRFTPSYTCQLLGCNK